MLNETIHNLVSLNSSIELVPTKSIGVGIYLLLIVLLSFFLNLLVVIVIMLRPKKKNSIDIFVIALATSDILFSVAIHPMLIATSFGANVEVLFSHTGCNWSGFGAVFFGCISMVIHGSISVVSSCIWLGQIQEV